MVSRPCKKAKVAEYSSAFTILFLTRVIDMVMIEIIHVVLQLRESGGE